MAGGHDANLTTSDACVKGGLRRDLAIWAFDFPNSRFDISNAKFDSLPTCKNSDCNHEWRKSALRSEKSINIRQFGINIDIVRGIGTIFQRSKAKFPTLERYFTKEDP